jgi:hypothetical protein
MSCQHSKTCGSLLAGREINEANDATVWEIVDDSEFAEVLVERDQNALPRVGLRQDGFIARISWPIASPDHVVPGCTKLVGCLTPHTAIEQ